MMLSAPVPRISNDQSSASTTRFLLPPRAEKRSLEQPQNDVRVDDGQPVAKQAKTDNTAERQHFCQLCLSGQGGHLKHIAKPSHQ